MTLKTFEDRTPHVPKQHQLAQHYMHEALLKGEKGCIDGNEIDYSKAATDTGVRAKLVSSASEGIRNAAKAYIGKDIPAEMAMTLGHGLFGDVAEILHTVEVASLKGEYSFDGISGLVSKGVQDRIKSTVSALRSSELQPTEPVMKELEARLGWKPDPTKVHTSDDVTRLLETIKGAEGYQKTQNAYQAKK